MRDAALRRTQHIKWVGPGMQGGRLPFAPAERAPPRPSPASAGEGEDRICRQYRAILLCIATDFSWGCEPTESATLLGVPLPLAGELDARSAAGGGARHRHGAR